MTEALERQAREWHRAGRLEEALGAYRELTEPEEASAEIWKLRAMAEHQLRRLPEATESIGHAIERDPQQPSAYLVAAHIAEDRHDTAQAEASFRKALDLQPQWAAAWSGLGSLLLASGRAEGAADAFRRAVDIDGRAVRAWNNLGMAQLALERFADAERALNYAVTLDPRYGLAHYNLARLHDVRGDSDRALTAARQAVNLDPRNVEAQLFLGDQYRRRRMADAARQCYVNAMAVAPSHSRAAITAAELTWETGFPEQAKQEFADVSQKHPGNFKAAVGARLILPEVYRDAAHVAQCREQYAQGLEQLHEIADRFEWARPEDAFTEIRWTNFFLAYQGGADRELQQRYGALARRVLERVSPQWLESPKRRASGGKLRIGFFSHFFYNCTAGRYFASWIRNLDREKFDSYVYYTNPWVAEDTRALAAAATRFRHLPGRPLQVLAQHVLADELDVLVYPELGMHADTFGLASLKLAPVQVSGWGHPTTTGLPSMDWFLSSAAMEPEGAQALYAEKLALLPGLGTNYVRPSGAADGDRASAGLPEGRRLYLVPQSVFKIHPDNDALIAEVLARDPQGTVVMFKANHPALGEALVARLAPHFEARGMEVDERVVFLPYMTHGEYLRVNRLCDVMLDTLHWSGGNTSLDALAMGLPLVTLPGQLMRGRQSAGMLDTLGVGGDLIARDTDDYVQRAIGIASDAERRRSLSAQIVDRQGELFGRDEPVRALETFLESAAAS
ncbi:tetratricopeptide repeat protein [Usitatibacter palustris]|uniref:protein O-GlcNAc transferase n=1 Tax=Usitatibacter palustris TaxID=2732487 RepID=A0A6M4HD37_9PROT|nr:tetratricopeptide repeat protein [Usitatibacter palustris]QJR16464.1 Lipopolysaccharide assembly protein B [Usitatibacter palustris]